MNWLNLACSPFVLFVCCEEEDLVTCFMVGVCLDNWISTESVFVQIM